MMDGPIVIERCSIEVYKQASIYNEPYYMNIRASRVVPPDAQRTTVVRMRVVVEYKMQWGGIKSRDYPVVCRIDRNGQLTVTEK